MELFSFIAHYLCIDSVLNPSFTPKALFSCVWGIYIKYSNGYRWRRLIGRFELLRLLFGPLLI